MSHYPNTNNPESNPYHISNPYSTYQPDQVPPGQDRHPYNPYGTEPTVLAGGTPPPYGSFSAATVPEANPYAPSTPPAPPASWPNASAPPPPPAAPPRPPRHAISKSVLLAILAVVIIVGAITLSFVSYQNARQATAQTRDATTTAQAQIKATVQTMVTATAVSSNYPFSANLKLDDPLTDNSKGYQWMDPENYPNSGCKFVGSAYHVIQTSADTLLYCPAQASQFSDFTYQVEMTIIQGDAGGIFFRVDPATNKGYSLVVGQDGNYTLSVQMPDPHVLKSSTSSAIHTGLNQMNLLGIVARGNVLTVYINQQQVAQVTDSTFSQGEVAVVASTAISHTTDVAYKNAKVWVL